MMEKETQMTGVAVVGAGLSGLMCAQCLQDYGLDVTLFEKSRGPSGRSATRRAEPNLWFDHGAQYFTVRHPRFTRYVQAWSELGVVAEWTGRIVDIESGIVQPKTDQPKRYVGVPGMTAMAHQLADGLTIRTETRIKHIQNDTGAWQITDAENQQYRAFDYLVLSLPAPQSAELLGNHSLAEEVKAVPMTPCWAVMLAFQTPVDVPWDGAFVRNSPLAWVARNSSKPGRDPSVDCWVLHGTPDWSASHRETSREAVTNMLVAEFAAVASVALPQLISCQAHRWLYSATPLVMKHQAWFSTESKLAIAGDWLAGGRVEGAILSGYTAASFILRHHEISDNAEQYLEKP